ncbi:hypothetical protein [Corallococcus macrosporus]|uniref:hypothetical protein n=1 Tax=Corallococcus macrosporus TaxID=35 RepID=UPI0012FE17AB|nr:hypothetical protein [Corallococcus macrosporus]
MKTANLTSPMNPDTLNDTVIGIDALALAGLTTARDSERGETSPWDCPPGR